MTELSFANTVEIEDLDLSNARTSYSEPELSDADPLVTEVLAPTVQVNEGFDYSGVSPDVADEAEKAVLRIRNRLQGSIIETGHDLISIKEKLGHGKFGEWLRFHFTMSERSAQNFMNASAVFGAAPGVIDVLPATTVYKLAAKGASVGVRQSVIDEIAAGTLVSHIDVETRLTAAKDEERMKRDSERFEKTEAIAWQKREKELQVTGKFDEDIAVERKRWDAKKAQKERQKEKKLAEAAERTERARLEDETWQQEQDKMAGLAVKVVAMLKRRLGVQYEAVSGILLKVDFNQLKIAMQNG